MKLGNLICIAILIFIPLLASATATNKFYIGANAGIFQADFDMEYLDETDLIAQNIAQTITQHGYTGGIIAGYRHLLSERYFLGTEFSANINSHSASFQSGASNTAFSDQININDHIDLSLIPGLILSDDISAYLKLGISYAQLDDKLSSPAGFESVIVTDHHHKNALGFAAGMGIAKPFTPQISIFTEVNYHDYGNIDFSNFQNFTAIYSHSSHVYAYNVVIGAAYTI